MTKRRNLAYADETKHFGEIEEYIFVIFFYKLGPSYMNAVDACNISKVWVGH